MKAISIRQPWAWAILNLGKDIENRKWQTQFRGPVLIHAASKVGGREYVDAVSWISKRLGRQVPSKRDLALGGIVGWAEIVNCVEDSASAWFEGPYGFVLDRVEPLPFRACRGQLSLFEIDYTPRYPTTEDLFA